MLNWTNRFNIFCLLDSQGYQLPHRQVDFILGAGANTAQKASVPGALDTLSQYLQQQKGDWCLGHISYDVKNEIEKLSDSRPERIGFPDVYFFCPSILIRSLPGAVEIGCIGQDPEQVFTEILNTDTSAVGNAPDDLAKAVHQRLSREEYLDRVDALQQHIRRGDCYEINFCQEFYLEDFQTDPTSLYRRMTAASPNPFSALYRVQDAHLVCASPERFIQKTGAALISQPIKGTIQRSSSAGDADELNRQALASSSKDRAENVMIVDLVRNDFSRICSEGSVQVEELFGIQTFPQVHHLVSTVRGILRTDVDFAAIIRACFPMGSMTGAPKKRVMELIDRYEVSRRGIFSGAVGYIDSKGDFDFNVVIRSIMYNAQTGYLSYQAGSGITHYSNPQLEYEECLLKASAIKKVLAG